MLCHLWEQFSSLFLGSSLTWSFILRVSILYSVKTQGLSWEGCCYYYYLAVSLPTSLHQSSLLQRPGISASLNPHLCLLDTVAWGSLSLLCGLEGASRKKARTPTSLTSSVSFLLGLTVLPVVHFLKTSASYVLSGFLIVYCGRVNLSYVILLCHKDKSHLTFDY